MTQADKDINNGVNSNGDSNNHNNSKSPLLYTTKNKPTTHHRGTVPIGGPGTILPRPVESFMGWCLALGCLTISGYHYIVQTVVRPTMTGIIHQYLHHCSTTSRLRQLPEAATVAASSSSSSNTTDKIMGDAYNNTERFPCWLPLTTTSRREQASHSPMERYQQLVSALQIITKVTHIEQLNDQQVVSTIRSHDILRRLATLAMRTPPTTTKIKTETVTSEQNLSSTSSSPHTTWLGQKLIRLWGHLLALPSIPSTPKQLDQPLPSQQGPFQISLIVPAYKEDGQLLLQRLGRAYGSCVVPNSIQLILVHAGHCALLEEEDELVIVKYIQQQNLEQSQNNNHARRPKQEQDQGGNFSSCWGQIMVRQFTMGGGRGPCLNFGANLATGAILTFLHSDTELPSQWDRRIIQGLGYDDGDDEVENEISSCHPIQYNHYQKQQQQSPLRSSRRRPIACAFSFGIDTSPIGLNGGPYPPGIKAVETTANWRTHLWSLPYGDQCLSVPSCIFHYIGGFPDQCLMEDYEFIALLRQRVALLPKFSCPKPSSTSSPSHERMNNNFGSCSSTNFSQLSSLTPEQLVILDPPSTLCSPRRWQKFGVLYVTFFNSRCVHLYAHGMTPDELFRLYYGRPAPPRHNEDGSPWEETLATLLERVEQ